MYTLYYVPGAASLLVHWLLLETGQLHELRLVDTGKGEQKTPQYLALNPNGVVPTLLIEGAPMVEAAAIAMHLADEHADAGLAPDMGSDAPCLHAMDVSSCECGAAAVPAVVVSTRASG